MAKDRSYTMFNGVEVYFASGYVRRFYSSRATYYGFTSNLYGEIVAVVWL